MPRELARDDRFDAAGGVNTAFSPDVLDKTELRSVRNGRILFGLIEKRRGSQRLHTNAIGQSNPVLGLYQWDAPAGRQLVAVSNGGLYHKLAADPDFTFAAGGLSTQRVARFATHRIGATIKLYVASDGLFEWDGGVLAAVPGAPAGVRDIAVYKLRMYAIAGTKTLYGSKIGAPTVWDPLQDAIQADVETYDTEPLTGLLVVGSSLLLFKADTIARFTGVDPNDIQIDTQTEGISPDVGCPYPATITALEDAGFFLSDRGPYLATEAGVKEIGLKIDKEFSFDNKALWSLAVAVAHRSRKEVWLSLPGDQETQNATTWVWNWKTMTWSGPWKGMPAASLARYQLTDGTETVARGGYDGFVRQEDVPHLYRDDVLADGSGGTPIELHIEYPELFFGDPTRIKSLHQKQNLQADLGALGELTATWSSELGTGQTIIPSAGEGVFDYVFRLNGKGRRLKLLFTEATATPIKVTAINPKAYLTTRGGPRGSLAVPTGSVTINGAPAELEERATVQLTATVRDAEGNIVVRPVSWSSSDPTKATVDGSGLVTAVAAGPVTIIARSGGITAQAPITITAFDDVAHLITDLGATPAGIWSIRRGAKTNSSGSLINMIEDWRIRRADGCVYFPNLPGQRITCGPYAGLNGVARASIGIWFRNYSNSGYVSNHRLRTGTYCGQWNTGGSRSWVLEKADSTSVTRLWFSSTDYAAFDDVAAGLYPGCGVKLWVTFDGMQPAANRVKFYVQLFDDSTGQWGPIITPAVTIGGNGPPATWPVSPEQFTIGGHVDSGNPLWGMVDEVRVIPGVALTSAQVEAEKVRNEGGPATAFVPDLWYSFENDSLANLGATGAANDGIKGPDINFCSDDWQYFPLVGQDAKRPGWDAVNKVVTFTDTQCLYSGEQKTLGHTTGLGVSYSQVSSVPVGTGTNWCVGAYSDGTRGILLGYNTGTGNICTVGNATLDLGVAAGPTCRAVSGVWPDNQPLKGQVYAHAIAVGASASLPGTGRGSVVINARDASQVGGTINAMNGTQWRTAALFASVLSSADLTTFGQWAVINEGAVSAA
jgi:hypothetical protein